MKLEKSICVTLCLGIISAVFGQYPGYPNYGQRAYPPVPTEIIDLPSSVGQQSSFLMNSLPIQPSFKPDSYGYYTFPYSFGGRYPSRQHYQQQYPGVQQSTPQHSVQPPNQLPKHIFRNPTPEFPNGYYVVPGSQKQVEVPREEVKQVEVNPANNETVQQFPGYVVKQTSQRYQSPNQNPIKITSSTVEHKPFRTVLTRYIDRYGKPIIKLENENGTMTLDGKGSTNLNINNGKLEINGVDPYKVTTSTTEKGVETTTENENATPNDVLSWIR